MKHQKNPLVSVIIPFLNEEKFLSEAIESVLRQVYTNWEIQLVDDGSNDKSTQIAKNYSVKYPDKIYYCNHKNHVNKGLSPSRNEGIRKSQGSLIAFLDADDVWLPEKLSMQVSIFNQHPEIAMVIEGSEHWYDWNNINRKNKIVPVGAPQDKVYDPPKLVYELYPLSTGASPCPTSIMVKKNAIARSGDFEESFIKEYGLYEDQAFLHKFYLNEKIFVSKDCNSLYRKRAGSIVASVRASGKYEIVRTFFLEWLLNYIKTQQTNLSKGQIKEVTSLIRHNLLPYKFPLYYSLVHQYPKRILNKIRRIFNLLF